MDRPELTFRAMETTTNAPATARTAMAGSESFKVSMMEDMIDVADLNNKMIRVVMMIVRLIQHIPSFSRRAKALAK